jgi:predicted lysophospholipase L1 biosynthesis ABC-type transport system permease subunit
MKPGNEDIRDERLHQVLEEWQVHQSLPPRFGEQVWRRIARAEVRQPESLWNQVLERVAGAFLRPSLAVGYVAALVLAGLLAGSWHARQNNAQVTEELGARYLQMMDPYHLLAAK